MSDEEKLDRLLQDFDAKESARRSSFRNTAIGVLLFAIALSAAALWTSFQLAQAEKQKAQALAASLKAELAQERAKLAESHRLLGVAFAERGSLDAAIAKYNQAIELEPSDAVTHELKGYALLRKGQLVGALRELKRAVTLDPTYIWGHYNLSLAYWKAGKRAESLDSLEVVIKLDPSFVRVIKKDLQFKALQGNVRFQAIVGADEKPPTPELEAFAYYGIYSGKNAWQERFFHRTDGDAKGLPNQGDLVVARTSVNARKGYIEYTPDSGWQNKPSVGLIKAGDKFRVIERKEIAGSFIWIKFRRD